MTDAASPGLMKGRVTSTMDDGAQQPPLVLALSGQSRSLLKIPLVQLAGAQASGAQTSGAGDLRIVRAAALTTWADAVGASHEPCLLLDGEGLIVAASPRAFGELLAEAATLADVVGRPLSEALAPTDFQPLPGDIGGTVDHLPPLLALRSGGLARGLLRLRTAPERLITVDLVAAALHDASGAVVGAVAFSYCLCD